MEVRHEEALLPEVIISRKCLVLLFSSRGSTVRVFRETLQCERKKEQNFTQKALMLAEKSFQHAEEFKRKEWRKKSAHSSLTPSIIADYTSPPVVCVCVRGEKNC